LLASIDDERRDVAAAVRAREGLDEGCGENGNAVFCAKAKLLSAQVALREQRIEEAKAAIEVASKDESIAKNPALERRLDLLRARLDRGDRRFDAAHAVLDGMKKRGGLSRAESTELDLELGHLAMAEGERARGIEALAHARETLVKTMTVLTPQVREIDAVLDTVRAGQ